MEEKNTVVAETVPERRPTQQPSQDGEASYRRRVALLRSPRAKWGLIFAALLLVVGGVLLWRYFASYESTDDAQVDGHLNSVSARVSGHVAKLSVEDNQYVAAGAPLVEIDPQDYDIAVASARAAYQDALATAESLRVNVPITTVNTGSQLSSAQAQLE